MSTTLQVLMFLFAFVFLLVIINMVRKNKLNLRYALLWLVAGSTMLLISIFPNIVLFFTNVIGFELASNMILFLGIVLLLGISLSLTKIVSKQSSQIQILTQELSRLKSKERKK